MRESMTRRVLKSLLIGLCAAVVVGFAALLLGSFAGTPGKLVASAYILPGLAFASLFSAVADPLFQRLLPEGGASAVFMQTLPFIVILWTLVFAGAHFWWWSRPPAQTT